MSRPRRASAALLASLALGAALAGCGGKHEKDTVREGLTAQVGKIDYTVYLTRQLNTAITPDDALSEGAPPLAKDSAYYGVFLDACNNTAETLPATDGFKVKDSQGNEYEPIELPKDNPFAYLARPLRAGRCIPELGSPADSGQVSGAMLLSLLPLVSIENRPVILEIEPPRGVEERPKEVDLDL
jgi:hypothetical protein